ncbi:hypothetical protein BA059_03730 [Mycolicibacterium sp. (ex Dasyatis americana)]|nr:hypothetical protein BA059_03730 [Mycolicibacterium sp. (ex Dasyatis americana)]
MFYPGKLHSVASESEGGKTWLACAAAAHEIRKENHVVYVDFEDDAGGIVGRLLMMQVPPEQIRQFFHYHRPMEPMKLGEPWEDVKASLELHPTLAVVDGVTEAMDLHNLKPNANEDIAQFSRTVPKPMRQYGCAVTCLDHVVKDKEGRGRYALGGVHKLNGLDGAAFILENRCPIGDNLKGVSYIRIAKDRPGQLRKHAVPGKPMFWFADLVVDLTVDGLADGVVTVAPAVDRGASHKPTAVMERVSNKLAQCPSGLTQTQLETTVVGKAATVREALHHLIADGYVTQTRPHKNVRQYFAVSDWPDDDTENE